MHKDNAWNIHKWFYVCLISIYMGNWRKKDKREKIYMKI